MFTVATRWSRRRLPDLPTGLGAGRVVYLDIETTGLWADSSHVTLVGMVSPERGGRRLKQFFLDRPSAEAPMLRRVRRELASFSGTVTYNGIGFDLPFLRRRARLLGLRWPWIETYDLLWMARSWKQTHGRLQNCCLRTVMAHFGVDRDDHTSGGEMVVAYSRWLGTRDPAARQVILDHNADDVALLPEVFVHLSRPPERRQRPARSASRAR